MDPLLLTWINFNANLDKYNLWDVSSFYIKFKRIKEVHVILNIDSNLNQERSKDYAICRIHIILEAHIWLTAKVWWFHLEAWLLWWQIRKARPSWYLCQIQPSQHMISRHISGLGFQKQVSREGTSNYIPQYLWSVITCHYPWYLFLGHESKYIWSLTGTYINDILHDRKL